MEDSRDSTETTDQIARLETELQRLRASEREAIAARDESKRREGSLRDALGQLNHDLRNGLGGILGFAALLREEEDLTDQQREDVTDIYNAGQKMLERLKEVLETTKRKDGDEPGSH